MFNIKSSVDFFYDVLNCLNKVKAGKRYRLKSLKIDIILICISTELLVKNRKRKKEEEE